MDLVITIIKLIGTVIISPLFIWIFAHSIYDCNMNSIEESNTESAIRWFFDDLEMIFLPNKYG